MHVNESVENIVVKGENFGFAAHFNGVLNLSFVISRQ